MVYPYKQVYFALRKECASDKHNNMDVSKKSVCRMKEARQK